MDAAAGLRLAVSSSDEKSYEIQAYRNAAEKAFGFLIGKLRSIPQYPASEVVGVCYRDLEHLWTTTKGYLDVATKSFRAPSVILRPSPLDGEAP
jgi:hypothetical protein